jgi:hypothetical protein
MTTSVYLTFWGRVREDEEAHSYISPWTSVLGLRTQGIPVQRKTEVVEVREVPDKLTVEQVQSFAQACLDAIRGIPLEYAPGGSFVRWGFLCDIARRKRIPIPGKRGRV